MNLNIKIKKTLLNQRKNFQKTTLFQTNSLVQKQY